MLYDSKPCLKRDSNKGRDFNPFQANVLFVYPLKTSENLWFSDALRGYIKGTLAYLFNLSIYLSVYLSIYLSIYLFILSLMLPEMG